MTVWSGAGAGRGSAAGMMAHRPKRDAGPGTAVQQTLTFQKRREGKHLAAMKHPALLRSTGTRHLRWWPLLAGRSGKKQFKQALT